MTKNLFNFVTLPWKLDNHIAIFKGENGYDTILVKEQDPAEEFNFTCTNNQDTKILFGIENSNTLEKSPVTRVLQNFVLEPNNLGTNTKPYSVKCENVCQVNFIVNYFDATSICNETNSENWNCGLKDMAEVLNSNFRCAHL